MSLFMDFRAFDMVYAFSAYCGACSVGLTWDFICSLASFGFGLGLVVF